jgi:hypothetical protein
MTNVTELVPCRGVDMFAKGSVHLYSNTQKQTNYLNFCLSGIILIPGGFSSEGTTGDLVHSRIQDHPHAISDRKPI